MTSSAFDGIPFTQRVPGSRAAAPSKKVVLDILGLDYIGSSSRFALRK